MPEDLDYEPLEPHAGSGDPGAVGQGADLRRLRDVPVDLAVEIGRAEMTVGETLALRPGSIIKLDRLAEEPLDLLVNGTRIARGEVVVIDEDFGLRITEVVSDDFEGAGLGVGPSDALAVAGNTGTEEALEGEVVADEPDDVPEADAA
jgi:flagellar motor switch protein FliN/FliY